MQSAIAESELSAAHAKKKAETDGQRAKILFAVAIVLVALAAPVYAGGFGVGSQLTWQVYIGVGKQFRERYTLLLGYRYMDVDYRNAGFLYDTQMSGLLAGFALRLK